MAARILKHEGKSQRRGVAIELGCGAAAIPATAAAWCGFETYATDIPEMVSASSKALEDHLRNGGFSGTVRAASLSWGRANAQAFARVHGRADLVIASECLYALKATDLSVAAATMEALASTIAELLSMNGVCLVLYNPRSDVEAYFWDALPRFNLRRRADSLTPWHSAGRPRLRAPARRRPETLRRRARGRRAAFTDFPPDSRVAADDACGGRPGLIFLF